MPRTRQERQATESRAIFSIARVICSVLPVALEVSDNMDFGELIVGFGTLALAGVTWRLARTTGRSVEAERASVEAMAMPYIISVPSKDMQVDEIYRLPGSGGGRLMLSLWNLGSGPGVVTNIRLICHGKELLVALPRAIPLAAGNQFNASIDVTSWPDSSKAATLEIEYLHSNGLSYRTESAVTIEENVLKCLTFQRSMAEEPGEG